MDEPREERMKKHLLIGIVAIAVILLGLPFRAGQPQNPAAQPQFANDDCGQSPFVLLYFQKCQTPMEACDGGCLDS